MPLVAVGDHRIHYQVEGEGESLVLIAGTGFDLSFWDDLMPTLAGYRVLRIDNRGSGMSDVPEGPYSIRQMADDVAIVMEAAGIDAAHVYGASMGSLIAQELAVRHPDRIRSLVLGATSTGVTMVPGSPQLLPLLLRPERYGAEESFRRSARFLTSVPATESEGRFMGHAARERDTAGYTRQLRAQLRYTSLAKLRRIRAPTLVLHGAEDRLIRPANARLVAKLIPQAKLRLIRGAGHLYNLDNSSEANEALLEFLLEHAERIIEGRGQTASTASSEATILFTDIVDSTLHLQRLGDREWLDLLERHNTLARERVHEFGGAEVRTTGDGLLAVFADPAAGVACAHALFKAMREPGLELRAGLHYGPVSVGEGDVHGLAVHAAARIAAAAGPGEVLVSRDVQARCPEMRFEGRGARSLKGLPGDWPLFAALPPVTSNNP